jgi:diguanylate cyclase
MKRGRLDFSAKSWTRVIVLTVLGTLCCIAFAFVFDSYSFEEGRWRLGVNPKNDVIIPLLIAPPFFLYLLSKLRELAIANERLLAVASTDGLTSCLTRAAFTTIVDAYLQRVDQAAVDKRNGALLILDVDHFKSVNDRFGHDSGDEALRLIVQSIKTTLRDIDLVGRMGGEEFGIFLPGISPQRTAAVAERIRATVKASNFSPDGARCDLSISIGVVTFANAASFIELYKFADRRLYDAKRNGRNRVEMDHFRAEPQLALMH